MAQNFYITTTLPYVNSDPHIGFGREILEADIIARYQTLIGNQVIFNTGTDEHGQKIYQQALDQKKEPQEYCDEYSQKFDDLKQQLNLSYSHFIRTTNPEHKKAAQEFWQRCDKNGFIYKAKQKIKYCVGCELEKSDSELEDDKCPLHPNKDLETREEENYFFKFSAFQDKLLNLYKQNPDFVKPSSRFKEIISFVENGLQDFSISRLKSKMPWGVAVPGDDDHVMYVWFDALINYISTLGWPNENSSFEKFWPAVQLAGKDNLRQQSAMWQAMLMAADLQSSKQILINGFISINHQKMSKSLGNVIAPKEMTEKYSVDATRFLLIKLGTFDEDSDASWERFDTEYKAYLQDGLGNACSRVAKMCEKTNLSFNLKIQEFDQNYKKLMNNFNLLETLEFIISEIKQLDIMLSNKKPWLLKNTEQERVLEKAVEQILIISIKLQPFMPETSQKILDHFSQEKVIAIEPLFPRLS
jgi:methionyl-tRNA synthetase